MPNAIEKSAPSNRKYKGWIPTVLGYLSYSVIGETCTSKRITCVNETDGTSRRIVGYQKRLVLDSPLPTWLAKRIPIYRLDGSKGVRREAYLYFLFVASAASTPASHFANEMPGGEDDEASRLKGVVSCYMHSEWKTIERRVVAVQDCLRFITAKDNAAYFSGSQFSGQTLAGCKPDCCDFAGYVFKGNVEIKRDGCFSLTNFEPGQDISFSDPNAQRDDLNELAAQAFYFVRDLVHRHQHHRPKTDQLTTVYSVDGDDSYEWMASTYHSIMRNIVNRKRVDDNTQIENSLGMLSYARTLHGIIKKKYKTDFGAHDLGNIELSLNSRINAHNNMLRNKLTSISVRAGVVGLALSILAINVSFIGAVVRLSNGSIGEKWPVELLTEYAVNPERFIAPLGLLVAVALIWNSVGSVYNPMHQFLTGVAVAALNQTMRRKFALTGDGVGAFSLRMRAFRRQIMAVCFISFAIGIIGLSLLDVFNGTTWSRFLRLL